MDPDEFREYIYEEIQAVQKAILFQQGSVEALISMAKNRGRLDLVRDLERIWHRLDITIPEITR